MTDPIPVALLGVPFTLVQAAAAGLTRKHLRGRRFVQVFRGVYVCAGVELTFALLVAAARLVLPADVALSHTSALRWRGVDVAPRLPLHFSTNTASRSTQRGIVLHRRQGHLSPTDVDGVPTLGPDRTLVDSATLLGFVALVQAAEMLVHAGWTTADKLRAYADSVHLDGVLRARRAFAFVRDRVESPMETLLRLMLVFARLSEPEANPDLLDEHGRFLGRVDLLYARWRVVVEYDGEWHDRSRNQRRHDRDRRQRIADAGWTVVVVMVEDLSHPRLVVRRVHDALVAGGYAGPAPVFNDTWDRWFSPRFGDVRPV
ncbi:hypothetical protein [Solicola sp. PLA-1-18]|uniref:hypothetical protein n=1 Tax=Solicola sp. PLA-1-18 TaxID=3380532 RepID=UPI003B77FE1D